jgi:hypothetical protein
MGRRQFLCCQKVIKFPCFRQVPKGERHFIFQRQYRIIWGNIVLHILERTWQSLLLHYIAYLLADCWQHLEQASPVLDMAWMSFFIILISIFFNLETLWLTACANGGGIAAAALDVTWHMGQDTSSPSHHGPRQHSFPKENESSPYAMAFPVVRALCGFQSAFRYCFSLIGAKLWPKLRAASQTQTT